MQKHAILALAALLTSSVAAAQYSIADPPLSIRWSIALGPSTATSSGRTTDVPIFEQCFSCQRTTEVVSGADNGVFHAGLVATGVPGRLGFALRFEGMLNLSTSEPYVAPPKTCVGLDCRQLRKAEKDNAFMFVGGLEYAPLDKLPVSPYLAVGGGLERNQVRWRQDSSTTSALSGKAAAFGPFAAVGGGLRATVGRWAAFMEWRTFRTFVTPGAQMSPLSIGVQYRPKRAPDPGA